MQCPQCGAETPDDAWNCPVCRINLYWAHQHLDELVRLRAQQGLESRAGTPDFLVAAHERELTERADRGLNVDNKVREIARRVMHDETTTATDDEA